MFFKFTFFVFVFFVISCEGGNSSGSLRGRWVSGCGPVMGVSENGSMLTSNSQVILYESRIDEIQNLYLGGDCKDLKSQTVDAFYVASKTQVITSDGLTADLYEIEGMQSSGNGPIRERDNSDYLVYRIDGEMLYSGELDMIADIDPVNGANWRLRFDNPFSKF